MLSTLRNKTMLFKVNDDRLIERQTKTWGRINILMNLESGSEPVYGHNDKYIKAKIRSYGDKVNTNFKGKKTPKENASYKCLSINFKFCYQSK